MASPAKRPRNEGKNKQFFVKQARKGPRNFIEVGDKGFLVTCNFRERDSIRECYMLLNEYHNKSNKQESGVKAEAVKTEEADDDIESQLKDQIAKTKQEVKDRAQNFNSVDTGVQNLIFIKTTIPDPVKLGTEIIRDLAESKKKKTKVTLRFLPIETVCKANIADIKSAGDKLFDKHFTEPTTFGINFNKRFNNDVSREEVIKELADIVSQKNEANKVNLKEPQKSIIVEIIKGHCLLTVVNDFLKLKKYNVNELWTKRDVTTEEGSEEVPSQEEEAEKGSSQEEEAEKDSPSKADDL